MNSLLSEMKRSMEELTLGLDGSLNMSPAMEALAAAIRSNSVSARWMAQMSTRIQEVCASLPLVLNSLDPMPISSFQGVVGAPHTAVFHVTVLLCAGVHRSGLVCRRCEAACAAGGLACRIRCHSTVRVATGALQPQSICHRGDANLRARQRAAARLSLIHI